MKAMISQRMRGKSDEEIIKTRKKAVAYLESQGYEVVNTYFTDDIEGSAGVTEHFGIVNMPLYYLAKSLEVMSQCDAVYFCKGWEKATGCMIEHIAANMYGLKVFYEPAEVHDQPQLLDTQCAVASLYSSITGYNAFGQEVNERLMKGSWEGQQ